MKAFQFLSYTSALCLGTAAFLPAQVYGGGHGFTRDPYNHFRNNDMASVRDHDGDGVPDYLFGCQERNYFGPGSGVAGLFSGATGVELIQFPGVGTFANLGSGVASAGDLNADGVEDFLVAASQYGASNEGAVLAYSGADGSQLHIMVGTPGQTSFGESLLRVDDLNGDGHHDFLIGQPEYVSGSNGGRVWAYSGATGLALYELAGTGWDVDFGRTIIPLGDHDQDGVMDFMVGEPDKGVGLHSNAGQLRAFSGATGTQLFQVQGSGTGNHLGRELRSVGDLDGDGLLEFATVELARPWIAAIRSGLDGSIQYSFTEEDFGVSPTVRIFTAGPAGDFNGDGTKDLFVADTQERTLGLPQSTGAVYVHSGIDGIRIAHLEGADKNQNLGKNLVPLGDLNGDGRDELGFCGASSSPTNFVGMDAFLISDTTNLSAATGGAVSYDIDFPVAAAGMEYRMLMSITGMKTAPYGTDIPLSFDSFLVDSWSGIYPFATPSGMQGTLDAAGNATADLTLPVLPPQLVDGHAWFAAVAMPVGQLPVYSTGVAELRFLP